MKQEPLGVPALGAAENRDPKQARDRFLACAKAGLFRHAVPETLGGVGTPFRVLADSHVLLGEKTHDPGLMLALSAHLWGAVFPLLRFANDEQKKYWIPSLLNGELIGGHAITEPQAGSDIQAMETTVSETAEGFMLNGHKRYITNSPIAGMMVIYAKDSATSAISAFILRSDDSGANFENGPTVEGCATATMGDITLSECEIPKDRALGASGAGATMIQLALELERAFIFAGVAGVMQWQLNQTIQYVRRRASGGGVLSDRQVISHKIADMKLRLETIRLWVNRCAELLDSKKRITLESAQTKLFSSEAFLQSSLDAAHIHGAKGLENGLAGLVLDGMAGRLMSGSSEVQKNIIAAMLGVGVGVVNEKC
ncbi:MAG: acyl-CoA dehydrogenase family protein [Gammaproteobacteria bacterium]